MTSPPQPRSRDDFHIAIICALSREFDAVTLLFDQFWDEDGDPFGRAIGDTNHYTTGRIGSHDVVLLSLSAMGGNSAAAAASGLRYSFHNLKLTLVVGICGGLPEVNGQEVILGDVVISKTIKQYDFGRQYRQGFAMKATLDDSLGRAPKDIRNLIGKISGEFEKRRLQKKATEYFAELRNNAIADGREASYTYPGTGCPVCDSSVDTFCQEASETSCIRLGCDESKLIARGRLANPNSDPLHRIFIGCLGSGNAVMKSGDHRERLARGLDVIAFEMEGAGVWDELPSLVVKGICDYADSHKSKEWQDYAALSAAAATKAILQRYVLSDDKGPSTSQLRDFPSVESRVSPVASPPSHSPNVPLSSQSLQTSSHAGYPRLRLSPLANPYSPHSPYKTNDTPEPYPPDTSQSLLDAYETLHTVQVHVFESMISRAPKGNIYTGIREPVFPAEWRRGWAVTRLDYDVSRRIYCGLISDSNQANLSPQEAMDFFKTSGLGHHTLTRILNLVQDKEGVRLWQFSVAMVLIKIQLADMTYVLPDSLPYEFILPSARGNWRAKDDGNAQSNTRSISGNSFGNNAFISQGDIIYMYR